jgi:hypothetical protein
MEPSATLYLLPIFAKRRIVETNALRLIYWWIFQPNFYAGYSAEWTFKTTVINAGYVAEPLLQSRAHYRESLRALGPGIKREDFIVRGRGIQAAVEVKCRTAPRGFYRVDYAELKRLEAMQNITGLPVALAFFKRTGRGVRATTLEMYWLNFLLQSEYRPQRTKYFEDSKKLSIPVGGMVSGLQLLDDYSSALTQSQANIR